MILARSVTRGYPHAASATAMTWLHENTDWDVGYIIKPYCVAVGRSEAVREALEKDADGLFMWDDDVTFPGERVREMPDAGKDIVAGLVPTWKFGTFHWNCYDLTEEGRWYSQHQFGTRYQEVWGVGAACLYLSRRVLEAADAYPLFEFDTDDIGCVNLFGGEDINFCKKMHRIDIPVHVDSACVCEHIHAVDMTRTMLEADRYADSDTHSRLTRSIAADLGESQRLLPVSEGYRRRRWARRDGYDAQEQVSSRPVPVPS